MISSISARDLAERAAFLFRLPFTRQSRGGMMPKLMFMGWNTVTDWLETYRARAPTAVSWGKSTGGFPASRRAVSTPARKPEAADSTYPSTPVICPAKAMRGSAFRR